MKTLARIAGYTAMVGLALPVGGAMARPRSPGGTFGDPSDLIATEIAFARQAGEKGFGAAIKDRAVDDAQVFDGSGEVRAATLTKARDIPPAFAHRVTRQVWTSCDGTYAVTRGTWREASGNAAAAPYTSVWQRQKKGAYRLILDMTTGQALPGDDRPVDFIDALVGDCPRRGAPGQQAPAPEVKPDPHVLHDYTSGESRDHTLRWAGARAGSLTVTLRHDGRDQVVLGR